MRHLQNKLILVLVSILFLVIVLNPSQIFAQSYKKITSPEQDPTFKEKISKNISIQFTRFDCEIYDIWTWNYNDMSINIDITGNPGFIWKLLLNSDVIASGTLSENYYYDSISCTLDPGDYTATLQLLNGTNIVAEDTKTFNVWEHEKSVSVTPGSTGNPTKIRFNITNSIGKNLRYWINSLNTEGWWTWIEYNLPITSPVFEIQHNLPTGVYSIDGEIADVSWFWSGTFIVAPSEVHEFVMRFYWLCLDRLADSGGLNYWVNNLRSGNLTGAQLAYNFIFSQEFINKNLDNESFLYTMYEAFFDRWPDDEGWNYWLNLLNRGVSRQIVLAGFINSAEFKNLCGRYGIIPGSMNISAPVENAIEKAPVDTEAISSFVSRLYNKCLGRTPDDEGLSYWVDRLVSGNLTGSEIVKEFVFSKEFMNSDNYSNTEAFLKVIYTVIFDREPDNQGWNYWIEKLNSGVSRNVIVDSFLDSQEFKDLCKKYGINPGR